MPGTAVWGRIIGATEVLLTRVAALEVVLEEHRQVSWPRVEYSAGALHTLCTPC